MLSPKEASKQHTSFMSVESLVDQVTTSEGLLDHALYINLDRRKDRREHIESELKRANIKARRISGVDARLYPELLRKCWDPENTSKCAGQVGCKLSHVKALKYAVAQGWPHVAIFEDDFQWKKGFDPQHVIDDVEQIAKWRPDWDVIVLSLNVQEKEVFDHKEIALSSTTTAKLIRVRKALTTHGYLVRAELFQQLIGIFESCEVESDLFVAIDTCWQSLQHDTLWYGLTPQMATQGESFSDIEGQNIFYGID